MGESADPITLHKYLYAASDPIDQVDPSGYANLLESAVALKIVGISINAVFWVGAYYTGGTAALAESIAEDMAFMLVPDGGISAAGKRIAQIFARTKRFKLGYGALGRTLAHNLRVFGFYGPFKWPAHHIVAGLEKFASAKSARKILEDCGIDINSPLNGVFLDPLIHSGRHLEQYSDEILELLSRAKREGGKDGVRAMLAKIQYEMRTGTSSLLELL